MPRQPPLPPLGGLALLGLLALAGCGGSGHHAAAPGGGVYKVGSPYEINGRWYYPAYEPGYDRTGTASWYGGPFDGQATANGEQFDKEEISAASTTLPLPSIVRVTNLENGRSLDVRVNDRGPFVGDRLIDLSQAAARRLGFEEDGLTPVRVQFLRLAEAKGTPPEPAPVQVAARDPIPAAPEPPRPAPLVVAQRTPDPPPPASPPGPAVITQRELPPPPQPTAPALPPGPRTLLPATPVRPPVPSRPVQLAQARPSPIVPVASGPLPVRLAPALPYCASGPHYVQVGAFGTGAAVRTVTQTLAGSGRLVVEPLFAGGQALARVKLGPFPSPGAALPLLDRVRGLGYREAVLVPAAGASPAVACTRTAMLVPAVR